MADTNMTIERARLLELSRERGASLSGLSELIGRNPAYLQQYVRRGTPRKLEEGDRRKLAQFFGVDEAELGGLTAEGAQDNSYVLPRSAYIEVPRLAIGASAGPGALPDTETPFDAIRFSRRWLAEQGFEGAQLSAITVKGDSMEPILSDGDEILVDRTPRPFRDGIHVVRHGDTVMVKRVAAIGAGKLSLLSQNMAYPPLTLAADDVEIIGRVVWKGGRI